MGKKTTTHLNQRVTIQRILQQVDPKESLLLDIYPDRYSDIKLRHRNNAKQSGFEQIPPISSWTKHKTGKEKQ